MTSFFQKKHRRDVKETRNTLTHNMLDGQKKLHKKMMGLPVRAPASPEKHGNPSRTGDLK